MKANEAIELKSLRFEDTMWSYYANFTDGTEIKISSDLFDSMLSGASSVNIGGCDTTLISPQDGYILTKDGQEYLIDKDSIDEAKEDYEQNFGSGYEG